MDRLHQGPIDHRPLLAAQRREGTSDVIDKPKVDTSTLSQLSQTVGNFLTNNGKITPMQSFMLIVSMIGGSGDFMGFIEDITNIEASQYLRKPELALQGLFLLAVGLLAAWAEARAKKNAMETNNGTAKSAEENPNQDADKWTLGSLVIKTLQTATANALFYASIADKLCGFKVDTDFDVSYKGLLCALIPMMYVTWSTVSYQYYINVSHQGHFDSLSPEITADELAECGDVATLGADLEEGADNDSCCGQLVNDLKSMGLFDDKRAFGRVLGTATDLAEELLFLLRNKLSSKAYVEAAVGFLVASMIASGSDARNGFSASQYPQFPKSGSSWASWCCQKKLAGPAGYAALTDSAEIPAGHIGRVNAYKFQ